MPIYIFKLLCNSVYLMIITPDIDRITTLLISSYAFQILLFGLMIYAFTQIENDVNSGFLVMVNVIFGGTDVLFRFVIERRINNRVVIR